MNSAREVAAALPSEWKKAKVSKAVSEGDTDGILASKLAAWGNKIPNSLDGIQTILTFDKRFSSLLSYDEFLQDVVKLRSIYDCVGDVVPKDRDPKLGQTWSDKDTLALTVWLQSVWVLNVYKKDVSDAIDFVATRFPVNSFVDKLESLVWDGKPRLNTMLEVYFNADANEENPKLLAAG